MMALFLVCDVELGRCVDELFPNKQSYHEFIIEQFKTERPSTEYSEGPVLQQDNQWCRVAGEWSRPKRRTESEDIEARGDSDECDDDGVSILLGQPRPPLLTGPLLIGPEFSLLLAVSVPHAHYVPLAVTVSHRYLVRRDKVCALALEMSDPMK